MARLFGMFAVACGLVAGAWRAAADDQPATSSDPAAIFKQLDANGDGQISDDEAPAARRQLFKRLLRRADANGDGKLSEAEFFAGMKEDRPDPPAEPPAGGGGQYAKFLEADSGEVFLRLDANGDGKLTREEFAKGHALLRAQVGAGQKAGPAGPGGAAALLPALDRDGDGKLSKEEIAAASASLLALDKDGDGALNRRELLAGPASDPPPAAVADGAKKKAKAAGQKLPDPEPLMARLRGMDANGDGKWSESELPPFLKKQFGKIDANGDGFVDAEEVKQALEVMRQRAAKRAAKAAAK